MNVRINKLFYYVTTFRNVHFLGTLFAKDGRKGIDAIMIGDQTYRISGWASANHSFPLTVNVYHYKMLLIGVDFKQNI